MTTLLLLFFSFFFFNDTATTEIYTLSLHDALPISEGARLGRWPMAWLTTFLSGWLAASCGVSWPSSIETSDRKSTRLNSSHANISYAVFCLKKKKKNKKYYGPSITNVTLVYTCETQ